MNRFLKASLLATVTLCLANCSAAFNREWKSELASSPKHSASDINGAWTGMWRSDKNGHHGDLRCIVSTSDVKTGASRFHYHATFMKFLSATYDVTHIVKRTKDGYVFSGDQAISGKGSGVYHYEGRVSGGEFHATFRSGSDHGVFEMKRP